VQAPAFNGARAPDFTVGDIYSTAALTAAVNVANPVNSIQGFKARMVWTQDGVGRRAVAYAGANWRSTGIAAQVTTANAVVDGTIWRVTRLVTGQAV
jgi:hypothetical protein